MTNPLARRLQGFAELTADDRRLLDEVVVGARTVQAHTDLIRQGDKPTHVFLILEGFACRYKFTVEGRRHIMAYLVPGDLCDLHVAILRHMDHTIGTLSPCRVVEIPRERILEMLGRPSLSLALWASVLADIAVLRE